MRRGNRQFEMMAVADFMADGVALASEVDRLLTTLKGRKGDGTCGHHAPGNQVFDGVATGSTWLLVVGRRNNGVSFGVLHNVCLSGGAILVLRKANAIATIRSRPRV